MRLQEGEIASATEGFAGSGQHHATGAAVTLQIAPDVQQLVVQGGVDDVEIIGPVDRHDADGAVRRHQKFVAHVAFTVDSRQLPGGPSFLLC